MSNSKINKITKGIYYLNCILDRSQKLYGIIVLFLTIMGAALETAGVAIILPLMQGMTDFEAWQKRPAMSFLVKVFHTTDAKKFVMVLGSSIGIFYVIKALYFIFLSWARTTYSCKIQRELSLRTFNSFIEHGYDFFLQNNTADLMRRINVDIPSVQTIVQYVLKFASDFLIVACISVYVIVEDVAMALTLMGLGVLCSILVLYINMNKIRKYGVSARNLNGRINSIMMQTFQGIKEVMVMRKEKYFSETFESEYKNYNRIAVGRTVIEEMPLHIIEGICVSGLIFAVSVRAALSSNSSDFIPIMATMAFAAFRILPSLGKLSSYLNAALYYSESLIATYNNFEMLKKEQINRSLDKRTVSKEETIGNCKTEFHDSLMLKSVSWHYVGSDHVVLNGINLEIKKGMSVGFIGKSGAGKSTLIDIILGLHLPTTGDVEVDGQSIYSIRDSWSEMIGYVPQSIYLADASIRDNIAFGIKPELIDDEKIQRCIKQAMLEEYISELPDGINTFVGERGVRMSGGQRQRLAIARALYHEPQILVLDEATSALDNETENAVMQAIEKLQGEITLIIVAHRLTTVRKCDEIYELTGGGIQKKDKVDVLE